MPEMKPHAVLLASPGMGHLTPVLELGKRLVTHHSLKVTIFVVTTTESSISQSSKHIQQSQNSDILNIVVLPYVDISCLIDKNASVMIKLTAMMRQALPSFRSEILAMELRPAVLIVDLFGTEALAMAKELGMKAHVLITSNAWFLALTMHVATFREESHENKDPFRIPGCGTVRLEDAFEPLLDRSDPTHDEYIRIGSEIREADGILVNTWQDLEPTSLNALRDETYLGLVTKVPVYPIGPIVTPAEPGLKNEVLLWLDVQPNESVIYVSFGSGGTLSTRQTAELAWGLELSGQRFVWVVRPPVENDTSASLFKGNINNNGGDDSGSSHYYYYLPDGFLTRTQNIGLVIPWWAPQKEILAHPSVGGFLSHCGWNSSLESIVNGLPMVAWPLYAEQKMNAALLTEELGVAVRPEVSLPEGLVGREEIGKMIRRVMVDKEGNAIRRRTKELQSSAKKALSKGGSSDNSLSQMVENLRN